MPIRKWAELLPYFILKRLVRKEVAPVLIMCGDYHYVAWELGEKEFLIIPYEKWKEKEHDGHARLEK